MMGYEIVKTESGKYALYINGYHIHDYSRKADAKRGYERYQARIAINAIQPEMAEIEIYESPLNKACRVAGEALYGLNFILSVFDAVSNVQLKVGAVQPHTPTQRTLVRGAAGAAARSPPLANRGGTISKPFSKQSFLKQGALREWLIFKTTNTLPIT